MAELEHWLGCRTGLNAWVDKYFGRPGAGGNAPAADLLAALSERLATLAPPSASGQTLESDDDAGAIAPGPADAAPFAASVLVGQVLAGTFQPDDAGRALHALELLQDELDLSTPLQLAAAFSRTAETSSQDAASAATSAIGDAARSDAWRIARALASTEAGFEVLMKMAKTRPAIGTEQQTMLMLQAWDRLAAAPGDIAGALAQAHATHDDGGQLAPRVLRALAGSSEVRDTTAVFAWQQGFRSDAAQDELKKLKNRLHRFVTRGLLRVDKRNWFFQRMFGHKKSALRSLRHGTLGAQLGSISNEEAKYCAALSAACRTMAEALRKPRLALTQEQQTDGPAREAAAAALDILGANGMMRVEHFPLDETLLAALCKRPAVSGLAAKDQPAPRLDLTLLKDCATRFKIDKLSEVSAVLGEASKVAESTSLKPDNMQREEIRRVLRQLISEMPQGAQITLADGGRIGISTRGLSLGASQLARSHLPIGGELTLLGQRSRQAVVTIAKSTSGLEIFIGTETVVRKQAGAALHLGYSAGIDALAKARIGGTVRVTPFDHEVRKPRGVVLRAIRPLLTDDSEDWAAQRYDDKHTTETALDLVDFLFDEANRPVRANGADTQFFERFAQHFQDRQDVSVGWQTSKTDTRRSGMEMSIGASVTTRHAGVRASSGAGVTAAFEFGIKTDNDIGEQSGAMRHERHGAAAGSGKSVQAGFGLAPAWGTDKISGGVPGTNPFGFGGIYPKKMTGARISLVQRHGKLMNRACYADQQFSSFITFAAAVDSSRDEWIKMYQFNHGCDRPRAAALLRQDLDAIRSQHRSNQTLLVRHRLRPACARQADFYRALSQTSGRSPESAGWSSALDALLRRPGSWLPERIALQEQSAKMQATGVYLPLNASATESVSATRELMRSK